MRLAIRIGLLVGLAMMIALIAYEGASSIMALLSQAGWVLLWLVPLHAVPQLLDVMGWRALIPARTRVPTLFWIAAVREAINRLLPVANVGGELVGIRLLALRGTDGTLAAASVIVEMLLALVSQFLFVALGVMCLLRVTDAPRLAGELLLGLGVSLPAIVCLAVLLRRGSIFARLERIAARLLGPGSQALSFLEQSGSLDAAIRSLSTAHARLAAALGWQLAGLIVGSGETWLALRWLGRPVSFAESIAIESLIQAARHFIFVIPAGLGIQEAALVAMGAVLGFGSDIAIALSLTKRMREVLFGLPALLAWQWTEGRRGFQEVRSRNEY